MFCIFEENLFGISLSESELYLLHLHVTFCNSLVKILFLFKRKNQYEFLIVGNRRGNKREGKRN